MSMLLSWLGAISYPFYLAHQPTLRLFMHASERYGRFAAHGTIVSIFALLASVALAHVLLKVYDTPVRSWLGRRMAARAIPQGVTVD